MESITVSGKPTTKPKIYFPNLNGLRFIAAFLVIIHHIEQLKLIFGLPNTWQTSPFISVVGKLGVVLFFVLSGFLITYLLLTEKKSYRSIDIKRFYLRRILRIWPLYYLILIIAIAIIPNIHFFTMPELDRSFVYAHLGWKIFLYILFLPNLIIPLFGAIPYCAHTWSIGTEEQFYLLWPFFIKHIKRLRIAQIFLIILIYWLISQFLSSNAADALPARDMINGFWSNFNIDCMAIGAIYAVILFKKLTVLKIIQNVYFFSVTLIILIVLMLKGVFIPYFHYEFYSVLFGIIILSLASNPKLKNLLENKVLNYLGKISYGLYIYHPIAIVIALKIGMKIHHTSNVFVLPATLLFTILFAGISYRFYESYFLKKKNRFTKILSGDEIEEQEQKPIN